MPNGEGGFRQHRRLLQAVARGQRQGLARLDDAVFGVRPAVGQRADGVADGNAANAGAKRDHFAGEFQPHDGGNARGHGVDAFALHDVRAVDAGVGGFDEEFARFWRGQGGVFDVEDVHAAGMGHVDALHGIPWVCDEDAGCRPA